MDQDLEKRTTISKVTDQGEHRAKRILDYLKEKWGDPPPNCPFCHQSDWRVDPVPVLFQRVNAPAGVGLPTFLVWCGNCGFEASISVQHAGLWDALSDVSPDESGHLGDVNQAQETTEDPT
jgi:hypothetical protein